MVESKCGFHIGDRVSLIVDHPDGNDHLVIGSEGEVWTFAQYGSDRIGVMWDQPDIGHDLDDGERPCEDSRGWWVDADMIIVIDQTEISCDADVGSLFE